MLIYGKYMVEDLERALKPMKMSRRAVSFNMSMDGSELRLSFEDDLGKQVTVTLFDMEDSKRKPTITRTEPLL